MTRRRTKRRHQRFGRLVLTAGLLALFGAALLNPDWLGHLSADGVLSLPLIQKVHAVCLSLLLASGILVTVGTHRHFGLLGCVIGVVAWLACSLVIVDRIYPGHLLFRPKALLGAVLGEEVLLRDYDPRSHLVVPSHVVRSARYPAIGIHTHFRHGTHRTPDELVGIMQRCNLQAMVDLDGELDGRLREEMRHYAATDADRFVIFATFWFSADLDKWDHWRGIVDQLDEAKQLGARGIKVWKNLGLRTRDERGRLIAIDDMRLEPLWMKADALGLPILIHVGDPAANFEPLDRYNERIEYLTADAAIAYQGLGAPRPQTLLAQFERVVERHPNVTFILAHLGNLSYDLAAAGQMLNRHPNLSMDISARANELGRQPVTARAFFIRYADRLLFGTDGNPDDKVYRGYFRLLETSDEYFDDPEWPEFKFGRWKLYGLNLPDDVLRKVYHDNAAKILSLPLLTSTQASKAESGRTTERVR